MSAYQLLGMHMRRPIQKHTGLGVVTTNTLSNLGIAIVTLEMAAAGGVLGGLAGLLLAKKNAVRGAGVGGAVGAVLGGVLGGYTGYEAKQTAASIMSPPTQGATTPAAT